MKLQELSDAELKQIIEQLTRKSQHHLDKYKRWEAQQKLLLARSEQRKRRGIHGVVRRIQNLLNE